MAVFLTLIGGQTYKLLRSLLAPELPATKKYEELTEKLAGHLAPKPLAIAERFKLRQRNQREGESVARYLAELRRLAEYYELGDKLDDQLRDQFVSGLRSVATQNKRLGESDLLLKRALELATSMEVADTQAQRLRGALQSSKSDETDGIVGTVKMKSAKNPKGSAKQTSKQPRQACYRCGRKVHIPQECWHRDNECRKCGKKGHIAVVCRSNKKATVPKPRKRHLRLTGLNVNPRRNLRTGLKSLYLVYARD